MEKSAITKLSPPWYAYHRKVQAMFGRDPEVHVKDLAEIGECRYSYMILISDKEKAKAIKAILPQNVKMGNIEIDLAILGPDEDDIDPLDKSDSEIYETAFSENPIFEKTAVRSFGPFETSYCIFKKEVIQFWNDDLYDYYGNYSRLASDIARELFNPSEIQYCISAE